MKLTVGILRELFRSLQAWEALYESEGVDTLTSPDGDVYNIFDIQYLYSHIDQLSPRQKQSIELFLYQSLRERDVAIMMGVSAENPVASYATHGLKKLIQMIEDGLLPNFKYETERANDESATLWDTSATRGRSDSLDQGVPRGSDLNGGEVGYPDPLEGTGPEESRGVQQRGISGRSSTTWHVPQGVESSVPSSELSEWKGAGTKRPPIWCAPKLTRSRRLDSTSGDGV